MPSALILGARNLGGAILDHLIGAGWQGAAVARSADTLERVRARGAVALEADASDPSQLGEALAAAARELGGLDLVVNAVTASRPRNSSPAPFGGGPLADATLDAWRGWGGAVAEQGFVFLSEGARALDMRGLAADVADQTCKTPAQSRTRFVGHRQLPWIHA